MSEPIFKKVLVAVDDSEQSHRALEKAIRLFQAKFIDDITIFNVYNTTTLDITKQTYQERYDLLTANSVKLLEKYEKLFNASAIPHRIKKAGGDPAAVILEFIEKEGDFDLLIMGSRRLNKIQELILGSVTDKVTRLVKIPVLVIK